MYHCGGCSGSRELARWGFCKPEKLCKVIDVSYVQRHPFRGPEHYRRAQADLDRGYQAARRIIATRTEVPSSPGACIDLLIELHIVIFQKAEPDLAGRFRRPDEPVTFGRGRHQLEGTRAERIHAELLKLPWKPPDACYERTAEGKVALAYWCARFLEKFYRIHPFLDGNGRVGRLFVELCVESGGLWMLQKWPDNYREKRKYMHALEYAHLHAAESLSPERRYPVVNPYAGLARQLSKIFDEVPDDLSEANPPADVT